MTEHVKVSIDNGVMEITWSRPEKKNAITNASRNFKGRFGSPESFMYVASSATTAASAIAGRIVPPDALQH